MNQKIEYIKEMYENEINKMIKLVFGESDSDKQIDYCNDLNEVRKICLSLDEETQTNFADFVACILGIECEQDCGYSDVSRMILANGKELCQALLLTVPMVMTVNIKDKGLKAINLEPCRDNYGKVMKGFM